MRIALSIVLSIIVMTSAAYGDVTTKAGTTAAAFLKIAQGARPMGMSGAFVSVSDDINALYWNPAGISMVRQKTVMGSHSVWLADTSSEYLAFLYPLPNTNIKYNRTIGASILFFNPGKMDFTDSLGNKTSQGSFSNRDIGVQIAYAQRVTGLLTMGVSLKAIQEKIADESASGISCDIGGLVFINKKMNFGFSVNNMGTFSKMKNESDPLPVSGRVGMSYGDVVKDYDYIMALDVLYMLDNDINISFGTEFIAMKALALRVGYTYKLNGQDIDDGLFGLGAGIGYTIDRYQFDYAYAPYGEVGDTHRLSFGIKW